MDLHLDMHAEQLIERLLRSGRYQSAEQVVVCALDALAEVALPHTDDERRKAVQDMLAFANTHGFTLGEGLSIRDLIREGRKY
jgi:Arc/MetJ-type ribon-helix-helix transcriptional regulator